MGLQRTMCLIRCAIKLVGQNLAHEEFVFRNVEMKSRFGDSGLDVISGFAPQIAKFAGSKAPDMLCSGAILAETLPQWVLVNRDDLSKGPADIARRVAEFLGHQSWQRSHAKESIDLLKKRFADAGTTLSDEQLAWLNRSTHSLSLKDQLALFSRDPVSQQAPVDTIFTNMSNFAVQTKQISEVANVRDRTDSSVLELIDRTPELKAIATEYDQ
jgi:ABC-type nitrate/sulfonate/bicarbonate transport system substrate-binding protein